MIAVPHTYEQVIEAEVAIEILNRAKAMLTARVYEIEADQPGEAERLRGKRRELLAIQDGIRVGDDEGVRAITDYWGALTKDEAAFWKVINAR